MEKDFPENKELLVFFPTQLAYTEWLNIVQIFVIFPSL